MAVKPSEMVGFHFLKKENDRQLEPYRTSYSYLGGKLNIFRSKFDICVKFWLPDRAQTLTLTQNISRTRFFLGKRRRFGGYLATISQHKKFHEIPTGGGREKMSYLQ